MKTFAAIMVVVAVAIAVAIPGNGKIISFSISS